MEGHAGVAVAESARHCALNFAQCWIHSADSETRRAANCSIRSARNAAIFAWTRRSASFSRAPKAGPDGPFRNRFGEVTVVPSTGGSPAPLAANDPNACAGDSLPLTLLNGSPTWGPTVGHRAGRSYYFLLFTSARKYGDEFSTPFQIGGTDNSGTLQRTIRTIRAPQSSVRVTGPRVRNGCPSFAELGLRLLWHRGFAQCCESTGQPAQLRSLQRRRCRYTQPRPRWRVACDVRVL
jgi:hypothetical protein